MKKVSSIIIFFSYIFLSFVAKLKFVISKHRNLNLENSSENILITLVRFIAIHWLKLTRIR